MVVRLLPFALVGIVAGNLATVAGAALYILIGSDHPVTFDDLRFATAVALSGCLLPSIFGFVVGLVWATLLPHPKEIRGQLLGLALVCGSGAAVGYWYSRSSPHKSLVHAILATCFAWAFVTLPFRLLARRERSQ
jgi:hypothetical protein